MKYMFSIIMGRSLSMQLLFLFLLATVSCTSTPKIETPALITENTSWVFPSFVKVDSINPILSPLKSQDFDCPISNISVNWEERNVLNPTALNY